MFAAIRQIYNIPRDENRKLRDYPTLAHVIRFVFEKRPDLAAEPVASSTPTVSEPKEDTAPVVAVQAAADDAIKEKVLDIVAEKSGYPKDMLDLDLDLEAIRPFKVQASSRVIASYADEPFHVQGPPLVDFPALHAGANARSAPYRVLRSSSCARTIRAQPTGHL